MAKSWRDVARPIIAQVLQETAGQEEPQVKKALRDAYPFGQRAMHPYKIWCDEVRRQRGTWVSPAAKRYQKSLEAKYPSLFDAEASVE